MDSLGCQQTMSWLGQVSQHNGSISILAWAYFQGHNLEKKERNQLDPKRAVPHQVPYGEHHIEFG